MSELNQPKKYINGNGERITVTGLIIAITDKFGAIEEIVAKSQKDVLTFLKEEGVRHAA